MAKLTRTFKIRLDDETRRKLETIEIIEDRKESDLLRAFINGVYKKENKDNKLLADEIYVFLKREEELNHEIDKERLKTQVREIKAIKDKGENINTLEALIYIEHGDHEEALEEKLNKDIKKQTAELKEANLESPIKAKPTKEEINDLKDSVIVFINLNGSTAQKNKIDKIKKASFKNYDEIKRQLDKAEINRSNNSLNNLISEILKK